MSQDAPPSGEDAKAAVARIADSGVLGRHSKLPRLLCYLVDQELSGKGDQLKGYAIAMDVLERSKDFDPATDSIVRVEVRRLRQALALYYATTGAADPLQLSIPIGSYRPVFRRSTGMDTAANPTPPPVPKEARGEAGQNQPLRALVTGLIAVVVVVTAVLLWPVLSPAPVRLPAPVDDVGRIRVSLDEVMSPSGEPLLRDVAQGLQRQLMAEMGSLRFLQVSGPQQSGEPAPRFPDAIHVRAHLQRSPDHARMIVDLVSPSGVVLWGNVYSAQWETPLGLQDELANRLLADLRPQLLSAARRLSDKISRSKVSASAWQSYIQSTWVPASAPLSLAWEKQRIKLALQALASNPDFGPAHAVLAQKLAVLAVLDPEYRTGQMRQDAARHALRAMQLAGDDPDAMFHVAVHHWFSGNLVEAEAALRRVIELEPSNFLANALSPAMRYTCRAAPQETLEELESRDRYLTPDNPSRWVLMSFMGALQANAGHWRKAELALRTAYFQHVGPDTFIPLAAVLHHQGDATQALVLLRMQNSNWPGLDLDFLAGQGMLQTCAEGARSLPLAASYQALANLLRSSRP